MARPKKEKPQEPLEKQLWSAADKLRKNIDAAEYKHVVLGLIFLKYISDAFDALHATLTAGEGEYEGADPENRDEYLAQNIFFVPVSARWSHLRDHAKQPDIGVLLDKAMEAIEQEQRACRRAAQGLRPAQSRPGQPGRAYRPGIQHRFRGYAGAERRRTGTCV